MLSIKFLYTGNSKGIDLFSSARSPTTIKLLMHACQRDSDCKLTEYLQNPTFNVAHLSPILIDQKNKNLITASFIFNTLTFGTT